MKFLLFSLPLFLSSAAFAAEESGTSTFPSQIAAPKEWKVTLEFAHSKVAAGAISNSVHQSEFTLQILDDKGVPLVGVDVPLPKVVKGGLGPTEDVAPTAKLSWNTPFLAEKQTEIARTDKKGQAKGIFTSGHRTETCEVELLGATSSIRQVWNEQKGSFDDYPERFGSPTQVGYTMLFKEDDEEFRITGHKIHLAPTSVELLVNDPDDGPDENGDGKPDGKTRVVTATDKNPNDPFWKVFLAGSKWDYLVIEDKPGHYSGQYFASVPTGAKVDGLEVKEVRHVSYSIIDDCAYKGTSG